MAYEDKALAPRWLHFLLRLRRHGEEAAKVQSAADPTINSNPDRVRAIVESEAQKLGSKAVLFGMWVADREILTIALGHSMTTVPATTEMHYRIGGIAETFMSTLLLMLVEQGRINLDDKIGQWLPDLLAADQVTVRMLVSNTAGYIDYVTVKDFLDLQLAEPFRTFTDEELINYSVRDGKMNFPPGTSQQYSHTDNVILGQVIQRATGQSMKELYDANIFGQLGMKDTQFPVNQEIQGPVLHAFTMDRKFYEDCTYWNPFWGSTPGLPTSNIHDLGKWGPILGHRTFDFAGALPGADRSDLGGQRPEQTGPLFRLRICRCQWLDCTEPQY